MTGARSVWGDPDRNRVLPAGRTRTHRISGARSQASSGVPWADRDGGGLPTSDARGRSGNSGRVRRRLRQAGTPLPDVRDRGCPDVRRPGGAAPTFPTLRWVVRQALRAASGRTACAPVHRAGSVGLRVRSGCPFAARRPALVRGRAPNIQATGSRHPFPDHLSRHRSGHTVTSIPNRPDPEGSGRDQGPVTHRSRSRSAAHDRGNGHGGRGAKKGAVGLGISALDDTVDGHGNPVPVLGRDVDITRHEPSVR